MLSFPWLVEGYIAETILRHRHNVTGRFQTPFFLKTIVHPLKGGFKQKYEAMGLKCSPGCRACLQLKAWPFGGWGTFRDPFHYRTAMFQGMYGEPQGYQIPITMTQLLVLLGHGIRQSLLKNSSHALLFLSALVSFYVGVLQTCQVF